jgi:hypothetical protein
MQKFVFISTLFIQVKGELIEELPETLLTNSAGKVEKSFSNGVAFNVKAWKKLSNGDSLEARFFTMLLEAGEIEEKKVIIKKVN